MRGERRDLLAPRPLVPVLPSPLAQEQGQEQKVESYYFLKSGCEFSFGTENASQSRKTCQSTKTLAI